MARAECMARAEERRCGDTETQRRGGAEVLRACYLCDMRLFQFSGFFQMMAISMMNLFPLYWSSLGYSDGAIGILNGLGNITAVLGPLFFAWFASRQAPSRLIAWCFLLSGFSIPLMLWAKPIVLQTAVFGLTQFLKVGYLTLVPVGVLHLLGPRAGLDYGRYRRFGSAGFLVAGLAGMAMQRTSPALVVWLVGGACLLAALPFLGKIEIPRLHVPTEGWIDLFRPRKVRYFLLGSFVLSAWNAGVWVFLPLRMREMGANPNLIAWTMAECGLIAVVSLGLVGRWADHLQKPSLLFLLVPLFAALRLLLMAWPTQHAEWFLAIQWTHVIVWVLGEVVQIQFVRTIVKPSLFPRAQAALQIGTYAGMGIASALMGLLVPHLGLRATIAASALLPLLAWPWLWASHRAPNAETLG